MDQAASRQFYSLPKVTDYLCCPESSNASVAGTDETVPDTASPRSSSTSTNEKVKRAQQAQLDELVGLVEQESHGQEKDLISYVADNLIGGRKSFSGPYGLRTTVYLDFTASARSLQFIEDYIQKEVLPEYGNTHTTTSITSLQTTLFRHEARDIIRNSCNASEHDSVIFVGSGTTGAVHKLIHSLHLADSPIVFVGPHEHHSNILPWLEMGAEVIRISLSNSGTVDIEQLEKYLITLQPFGRQMVGAFSAASNVTGVTADVNAITITLHKYGALAFWDYAAAAPYVKVDMNPYIGGEHQELVYKDAVYFSVHKFVGGVGCPGVLIAKKKLFQNPVPHECGGGTVFFVRRDHHRYLVEPEMKEEGGTPDIVGSIRAGLVFQLRDAIGTDVITIQDLQILRRAIKVWQECPELVILGPNPGTTDRLPIISFMVQHPLTGFFLHHNFVTAVLNDVFGIQARGGCACAGPYAMDIMGMSEVISKRMEELLAEDSRLDRVHLRRIGEYSHREIIRPGFVRINLPYFLDTDAVDFVIEAVRLTSQHAWKLLPQTFKDRKWLGHISYTSGSMSYHQPAQVIKGPLPSNHQDCLEKAREIFSQAEKTSLKIPDQSVMFDDQARPYRWFLLPSEANLCLHNKWKEQPLPPTKLPFCPPSLLEKLGHDLPSAELKTSHDKMGEVVDRVRKREKEKLYVNSGIKSDVHEVVSDSTKSNAHQFCMDKTCGKENADESRDILESEKQEANTLADNLINALEKGFVLDEKYDYDNGFVSNNSKRGEMNKSLKGHGLGVKESVDTSILSDTVSSDTSYSEKLGKNPEPHEKLSDLCQLSEKNNGRTSFNGNSTPKIDSTGSGAKGKDENTNKNDKGNGWFAPPKVIFKPTVQVLEEYNMLVDGDKVLVCLSGGKDSLSLLHTLRQYQFYARKKGVSFTFGAVTVDPQTSSYDPSPLKRYLAHLGVPYFYESQCIMETATNLPYECASICSFCSRMKRGRIYAAARREGYNVLALGQHLDDLSESFMMSFLHNGSLNTMKAHYTVKEGDLRVIRPFVYVRETELRSFAEQNKLPVISENCPACFEAPKERHRTKQLLAAQEVMFPQVYSSMMAALKPLMARGRQSGMSTGVRTGTGDAGQDVNDVNEDDDMDL